ncbi:MAG TPA: four helix bundle protein [Candidatus Gracilibacteria bacterium]
MTNKIKSFTDLEAWKESHRIALSIYKLTKDFPKEEIFGLTNQLRRASVSVSSNIAEGFSRYSNKEKHHFYRMALGSLTETQSQMLMARDINYVSKEAFDSFAALSIQVSKLLNGLVKKVKTP